MLIKFGSIVVGGRGKLGGQVYSHNRGGDYVRNNAVPVNPQSTSQMQARARLAQFSSQWSALEQEQISAWNEAAVNFPRNNVFGDSKILSGKNLFTSLNTELELVGLVTITDAPQPQEITVPVAVSDLQFDSVSQAIDFQVENTAIGDRLVIRATPPVSAGTSFIKNKLRIITVMAATDANTAVDLGADYVAKFGAIQQGQKIFVSAYSVNEIGQRSPEVRGYAIVAGV